MHGRREHAADDIGPDYAAGYAAGPRSDGKRNTAE